MANFDIILGMGFVTAALCGLAIVRQSPAPQKIWQGFGVNIHSVEPAPGEIELLQAAGMDYVRADFAWESIESKAGQYDFSAYDKLVGRLKAAHIRPLFVLDYGNPVYEPGAPKSDKATDAFASWAAAAVAHYKGEEIVWEIWNEPNVDQFWRPKANPAAYTALAVKTAKAMRQADPTCRIIGPAVSKVDIAFLRSALTPELLGLIDGVSLHPYRSSGPETVYKDYIHVQELIRQIAPPGREDLPVICSEWGYSTYRGGDVTEERQAMYVAKLLLLSASSGCPISIYYDWKDKGPSATNKEHRYGIVRSDLSPKPSFDAVRLVLKAFKGCTIFRRMQKKDPLDWVIVGAGDGKLVRATWYQKVGGMPRFEAYDMADRSNRELYNRIVEESRKTSKIEPKTTPKSGTQTEPTTTSGPFKKPDPKTASPNLKTPLNLSFAPPIDADGWCAVITKPAGIPAWKVEFRYDRKETGAKVTCFATASSERTVEPLADTDLQTTILALVGGQKIGEYQVQMADMGTQSLELKSYRDGPDESRDLVASGVSASVAYELTAGTLSCGITPKLPMDVPEGAKKLVLWIKSDGSNNRFCAKVRDEAKRIFAIPLGNLDGAADRNGWRVVVIPLTDLTTDASGASVGPTGKLQWDHLLYIEAADKAQPRGGKIEIGPAAYEF